MAVNTTPGSTSAETGASGSGVGQVFRDAMASVCTPVTIVTGLENGRPHGTTVSAFSSLSVDPPMVMVALDRGSDLLALVRSARRFGVNLLGHDHAELALQFARKGLDKFDTVEWREDHGLPRIASSSGWLVCDAVDFLEGGDHLIVLGLVIAADPIEGAPLVYHNRRFGTHSDFSTGPEQRLST
jgi:flavin reductase (DIM6/NTAB) family NADH-FMN oxidoreductase RutF